MYVVQSRNVSAALCDGVALLLSAGDREESRAGPVMVVPAPVTTVYRRPTERVLFSAVRDANPFFHLMESLWMLAGRDDAGLLNNFVTDFGQRFAESASGKENWEPGGVIHGAYGHRWRSALGFDQLKHVIAKLREDPTSRQCVIQMWDANVGRYEQASGMGQHADDLTGNWRDRPCNTHAYLRIREQGYIDENDVGCRTNVLDMTVCCRSNDIIWGAYGANAVHFSVLQEYLAAMIGVEVGTYYQISNNFHAYRAELERLARRGAEMTHADVLPGMLRDLRYGTSLKPLPLVDDPECFDAELATLLALYEAQTGPLVNGVGLENRFLSRTVWPALRAHRLWKARQRDEAVREAQNIAAPDWRAACIEWFQRRLK